MVEMEKCFHLWKYVTNVNYKIFNLRHGAEYKTMFFLEYHLKRSYIRTFRFSYIIKTNI